MWADHFDKQGIQYAFFSAANATALQEARREAAAAEAGKLHDDEESSEDSDGPLTPSEDSEGASDEDDDDSGSHSHDEGMYLSGEEDSPEAQDPRAKVLTVLELEDLFNRAAPDLSSA